MRASMSLFKGSKVTAKKLSDPFARSTIANHLTSRLALTSCPEQNYSSLCGPATFFYCLQIAKPDLYQKAVWDLWSKGQCTLNNLNITASRQVRQPHGYFI